MRWRGLVIIIFFFVSAGTACLAQREWTWQNPLPNGNDLKDIAQFKNGDLLVVGSAGTIMRSTDHGSTWSEQFNLLGTPATFRKVFFISDLEGWIVGDSGIILHSSNGGESWSALPAIGRYSLTCVTFLSSSVGCIGGNITNAFGESSMGLIWRTTDGGSTWDSVGNFPGGIFAMVFPTDSLGLVAAGDGAVYRSPDGGKSWSPAANPLAGPLHCMAAASRDTIWAGGYWTVESDNGGSSWSIDSTLSGSLESLHFTSPLSGWAALDGGIIARTIDGGVSWQRDTLESGWWAFKRVYVDAEGMGVAVGWRGIIYTTNDSGASWAKVTRGVFDDFSGLCLISQEEGWVGSLAGLLMHTTDGGSTWDIDRSHFPAIWDICFVSRARGWAVGDAGIMRTTNGGSTWRVSTPPPETTPMSVSFIDSVTGWIAGQSALLKTSDGGFTWEKKGDSTWWGITKVQFLNKNLGYVLTMSSGGAVDSSIHRTTDGGETWSTFSIGTSPSFFQDFYFATPRTGWVAGELESIWKTTDSGATWAGQHINNSFFYFHAIRATSETHAWAVGGGPSGGSIVLTTTDGGTSWQRLIVPGSHYLLNARFANDSTGWIVGYGGTILKMGKGSTLTVDSRQMSSAPASFTLCPNYPNPFNPSTRIKYTLPSREHVTVEIFNILGQRVATVVDEIQDPGEKSIVFDGSGLPSAVYLCRLTAGRSRKVIKMLLLR